MSRLLLRGGHVHTPAAGDATAVAVRDGKVLWVGDEDGADHYVDNADRVVDVGGRLVTPAFVDAHTHLAQTGFAYAGVDLTTPASRAEALESIASYCHTATDPVVLGHGWDETVWPESQPFTREELDRASDGRPAFLTRVDAHSAVVSTAFLDACPEVVHAEGYHPSGRVERDAHHAARAGVFRLLPLSAREDAILRALSRAASMGIGMVHELAAPQICPPEDLEIARRLTESAPLPEVVGYWGELGAVDQARELGCTGAAGDLCVDGSLGSHSSALFEAYADDPGTGHLYLDAEQVSDHVVACTRAGLQAGFHVIGDRAVAEVVEGYSRAVKVLGADAVVAGRHRLEHVEMVDPAQMDVLVDLGVAVSMQPVFDQQWGGAAAMYAERLGSARARPMNAFASWVRAGARLAFGSDSPVTELGGWAACRAAVWHRTESERIPASAAFEAHTRGGWHAARRDGGVLVAGAPASLAVWEVPDGATTRAPAALPELRPDLDLPTCVLTMVRGSFAYDQGGL
ncbi:MAG TPA: amidohydrolase family protein [Nocardioidaceae bacterium]|nr:amidohydrolase family protein [Nocardioidaceae bacterium]